LYVFHISRLSPPKLQTNPRACDIQVELRKVLAHPLKERRRRTEERFEVRLSIRGYGALWKPDPRMCHVEGETLHEDEWRGTTCKRRERRRFRKIVHITRVDIVQHGCAALARVAPQR
jgi:hypothetical protein